jgi:hypothetical protein
MKKEVNGVSTFPIYNIVGKTKNIEKIIYGRSNLFAFLDIKIHSTLYLFFSLLQIKNITPDIKTKSGI